MFIHSDKQIRCDSLETDPGTKTRHFPVLHISKVGLTVHCLSPSLNTQKLPVPYCTPPDSSLTAELLGKGTVPHEGAQSLDLAKSKKASWKRSHGSCIPKDKGCLPGKGYGGHLRRKQHVQSPRGERERPWKVLATARGSGWDGGGSGNPNEALPALRQLTEPGSGAGKCLHACLFVCFSFLPQEAVGEQID